MYPCPKYWSNQRLVVLQGRGDSGLPSLRPTPSICTKGCSSNAGSFGVSRLSLPSSPNPFSDVLAELDWGRAGEVIEGVDRASHHRNLSHVGGCEWVPFFLFVLHRWRPKSRRPSFGSIHIWLLLARYGRRLTH